MSKKLPPHPMQPIYLDEKGTARFRANKIVQWMVEKGGKGQRFDLNDIAGELGPLLDVEEHEQFNQLLGYSVCGFGDLSGMRRSVVAKADRITETLLSKKKRK